LINRRRTGATVTDRAQSQPIVSCLPAGVKQKTVGSRGNLQAVPGDFGVARFVCYG